MGRTLKELAPVIGWICFAFTALIASWGHSGTALFLGLCLGFAAMDWLWTQRLKTITGAIRGRKYVTIGEKLACNEIERDLCDD